MVIEFMPTTTSGKVHLRNPSMSTTPKKPARIRHAQPALNRVQLGVQMLLDDRANRRLLKPQPAARPTRPATIRAHPAFFVRSTAAQQLARQQPEDHRGERRNETQRQVAAAVELKRFLARGKRFKNQTSKSCGRVGVLVPVGSNAFQMRPVGATPTDA